MIKSRRAKNAQRGLYIQDKELQLTDFQVGNNFSYMVDIQGRKLIISPSEQSKNTVSKRKTANGLKPVIDIRDKKTLEVFKGSDFLEVEIFQDQIIVTGYDQEKETGLLSSLKNKVQSFSKKGTLIDFKSKLRLRQRHQVMFSRQELQQVVGQSGFQQLSIFDLLEDSTQSTKPHLQGDGLEGVKIPLEVISLFSGAGIMDTGFLQEGFEIKFALELDSQAVETYRHNIGEHIECGDITKFDKTRFTEMGTPIMIGGSPCQGFSNSNRHTNFLDNPNNLLLKEFIESIKANKSCQVFVIENVPQILTAGGGRFKEEIYKELAEFEITSGVLSSVDYGEAQDRKRAFIIGSKIGKIELPRPTTTGENKRTVRYAFKGLNDSIPNQNDYSKGKPMTTERMSHVPEGGNWRDLPEHLQTAGMKSGNTHSSIYKRLEWDKPSITIANPRKSNITHPSENRILSVRECARLFGVADDFVFKGRLSAMQQQICNSVPVKLSRAIAESIRHAIQRFNVRNGTDLFQLV